MIAIPWFETRALILSQSPVILGDPPFGRSLRMRVAGEGRVSKDEADCRLKPRQ